MISDAKPEESLLRLMTSKKMSWRDDIGRSSEESLLIWTSVIQRQTAVPLQPDKLLQRVRVIVYILYPSIAG